MNKSLVLVFDQVSFKKWAMMKIIRRKIFGFVLTLLFPFSLCSMEAPSFDFPELPNDMKRLVMRYLDLNDFQSFALVCSSFNELFNSDDLWLEKAQNYLGEDYAMYRTNDESWKTIVRNQQKIVTMVRNLKTLDDESIREMISDENYPQYETHLLNHIEIVLIKSFKPNIRSAIGLAAMLIANYVANLNSANGVTSKSGNTAWDDFLNAYYHFAYHSALNTAKNDAWDAYLAAINTDLFACMSIEPEQLGELGGSCWKLENLFFLARMSQKNFLQYFEEAFKAAKKTLYKDTTLNKSKDDIIAILGQSTWEREDLKTNPYIISLKRIVYSLAKEIEEGVPSKEPCEQ